MPSSNSQLDRLLARYEVLVKTTPHVGHRGVHVLGMLPKMRGFAAQIPLLEGAERVAMIAKVNRWLGFVQGWLWTQGIVTVEELADETRGIDSEWCLHGHRLA